jgi:hypothetical protein
VNWGKPAYDKWESALSLEDVDELQLDGFTGSAAWPERNVPALVLNRVTGGCEKIDSADLLRFCF